MEVKPFFSCKETSRLIAEGETSWAARLHLLYCRHCRKFRRQLRLLGAAARRRMATLSIADDLSAVEQRLLRRLRST